jgi:CheY-like chemotaxis protein
VVSKTDRKEKAKTKLEAIANKLAGIKVLVVDDLPDNQFLVTRLLTKSGAVVDIASDGREGLEKACSGTHDIVLMDIQMPNLDGYQAKKALDEKGYQKPVVALTAHAMTEERTKTMEAGFAGHLTKPLIPDELIQKVLQLARGLH